MDLPTAWYLLIAALFVGYLVLEGFDFGVGMLLAVLGRDDTERRVVINTIAPVWDANEVWLITAVAAMFAAFPDWYATVLSGLYLPLLAILVALILRGVAFEYRGKRPEARWRARWDTTIVAASLTPAVLWGVVLATITRGLPLDAAGEHTGDLGDLLHPYALLGGATTAALFATHGAVFLALKTTGDLRRRAGALARRTAAPTAVLTLGFLGWTLTGPAPQRAAPPPSALPPSASLRPAPGGSAADTAAGLPPAVLVTLAGAAAVALLAGLLANRAGREGRAFAGTATAIGLSAATLFATGYPTLLPATTAAGHSLTIANAAAGDYSLTVSTWAAALFAPPVLLYQGWTYWVFRRRIGVEHIPEH